MKSTAGESLTASASMRNSASRSQPSLLTGTKASLTPVMFSTAAISALATAAWETITPRSGLLIVPLQVLLKLPRLSHALEQALVEPLGRVHAAVAQQVMHRHHLADYREVLPGVERHRDDRHGHLEDVGPLLVQPGAVVLARGVPIGELHHDLHALLLPHRADPEQRLDVDQPHAADLHVVTRQVVPAPDQHVVAESLDVHHVVRHEPVTALHQVEHALALADPGAAHEQ